RGQGRRKRSPSPSCCKKLCCLRRSKRNKTPEPPRYTARYTHESDTDEVTIRHATIRRSPRTSLAKVEVDFQHDDLITALAESEKRLSNLESSFKKTKV
ncbi:MAG: hypothetical protein ACR2IJ_02450, partial [Fluviibacter sp.]